MRQLPKPEIYFEHGKIPPQALDLEQAVLGAMMLESQRINEVMSILCPESFYKSCHVLIYESIIDLFRKNEPADILTVTEDLRAKGKLEEVGGPYYITMLTNRIGSTANVEFHARIILQKYLQREIIRTSSQLIQDAYDDITDSLELVEQLGRAYDALSITAQSGAEMVHVGAAMEEVEKDLKQREQYAKVGKVAGIPAPLKGLNSLLGGWKNTDLIIIAARPAMGKTALMLQIAKTAAVSGVPVGIFSLEMSTVSLTDRLTLAESGIDDEKYRSGFLSKEDWGLFYDAKSALSALPIYIDDRAALSMHQIRAKATQMKRAGKCGMVLIDYLQLTSMKSENRQYNREQEVSESSRAAKGMAKTMNVPVILLSQLSRAVEGRGGVKIPMLSDLRESGSIEQDADVVIFPHRPAYYDNFETKDGESSEGVIDLIIAKHRKGPVGTVNARHNKSMTRIFDKPTEEIPPNTGAWERVPVNSNFENNQPAPF